MPESPLKSSYPYYRPSAKTETMLHLMTLLKDSRCSTKIRMDSSHLLNSDISLPPLVGSLKFIFKKNNVQERCRGVNTLLVILKVKHWFFYPFNSTFCYINGIQDTCSNITNTEVQLYIYAKFMKQ